MFPIHLVRLGIVEDVIAADATTESVNTLQVRLHVGLPLTFGPTVATVLKTDRGIYRECCGAIRIRRIHVILESVTCDAHVIFLVEVVKLEACESLLFHCYTHSSPSCMWETLDDIPARLHHTFILFGGGGGGAIIFSTLVGGRGRGQ